MTHPVTRAAAPLSDFEIATSLPLGAEPGAPVVEPRPGADPRTELERVVAGLLATPPCVVTFSGGRDSSAVLAVAAHVARREGLPLPVAHTLRFPAVADSHEDEWQELVIRHLGVDDWVKVTIGDELGFTGPVMGPIIRRHGLLFPSNAPTVVPACRDAVGGTVLTGVDGDGLLGGWGWQHGANVRAGRAPRRGRNLAHLAVVASAGRAGAPLRWAWHRRRTSAAVPWLTPPARRRLVRGWAAERAGEPTRWPDRVAWYARRRYLALIGDAFAVISAETGARLTTPLLDPDFLAAMAAAPGPDGYGGRSRAMAALFGDLLPTEVLTRRSKAVFSGAFWTDEVRAFVRRWAEDVAGGAAGTSRFDPQVVDLHALALTWLRDDRYPSGTDYLAQALWLAAGSDGEAPDP